MDTILITGGTGKIGGQLVHHFLGAGWRVLYTSRSRDGRQRLAERFGWQANYAEHLHPIVADFYATGVTEHILDRAAQYGTDVLVNNARDLASLAVQSDGTTHRRELQNEYLIDVILPYELATGLIDRTNLRHVINIGSMYGLVPFNPQLYGDGYPRSAPIQYSLAKAALNHLTRELAIRYRGRCQVNTVSYGGVAGRVGEDFLERYARLAPEGRMLSEEQTVGPVAFLASAASAGITGQNIIQDGGWTVW